MCVWKRNGTKRRTFTRLLQRCTGVVQPETNGIRAGLERASEEKRKRKREKREKTLFGEGRFVGESLELLRKCW